MAAAVATATTIYVCITCRDGADVDLVATPGAALADATMRAAAGTGITVLRVRCLANCKRGLSAAVRRNHAWTYLFGGLDAENRRRRADRRRTAVFPRDRRRDAVARPSRSPQARADRAHAPIDFPGDA